MGSAIFYGKNYLNPREELQSHGSKRRPTKGLSKYRYYRAY